MGENKYKIGKEEVEKILRRRPEFIVVPNHVNSGAE